MQKIHFCFNYGNLWWGESTGFFQGNTTAPNTLSPYAVAKVASDLYVRMAGKAFGLPYIVMSCCNKYSRKDNEGFIVEVFLNNCPATVTFAI
ncbi:MAG: NAD-dependent epimerase/dehydratase family protein [Bacteroidetes bacterium]|nr:NAD-dependent epimerase/dehydratase family protein [Bacteroidota bacterium]